MYTKNESPEVKSDANCAKRTITREASELRLNSWPFNIIVKGVEFQKNKIEADQEGYTKDVIYFSLPNRNVRLIIFND